MLPSNAGPLLPCPLFSLSLAALLPFHFRGYLLSTSFSAKPDPTEHGCCTSYPLSTRLVWHRVFQPHPLLVSENTVAPSWRGSHPCQPMPLVVLLSGTPPASRTDNAILFVGSFDIAFICPACVGLLLPKGLVAIQRTSGRIWALLEG